MADEPASLPEYRAADGVDVHFDGTVLRCALNRPKTRNSVDSAMMLALIDAVETAALDERVRVILLTSANDDFCAGADIVARNAPGQPRPRVGSIQRRLP